MNICTVVQGPSFEEAKEQMQNASFVEWRLDHFDFCDTLDHSGRLILTLRPVHEGGKCTLSEDIRLQTLEKLASLNPTYIDLEHTVDDAFVLKFKQKHPHIQVIRSKHYFEGTPEDLSGEIAKLQALTGDYYKLATVANTSVDTYRMLNAAKNASQNCLLMTMGEGGATSRILAPIVNRPFIYLTQITHQELLETYNFASIHPQTAIYGLIGDPIAQSLSHITHNAVMKQLNLESVYIKNRVAPDDLGAFLQEAKKLGVKGLSVTIPHKEQVMQYCDEITVEAKQIGAVNTLLFKDDKIIGSNTDACGAYEALMAHTDTIRGKRVVILGAGGSAKAIAWQLVQKGAHVCICNRTKSRAQALAEALGCQHAAVPPEYDIIINTIPTDIDTKHIIPGSIAMDIRALPKNTPFLQEAKKLGCIPIYGHEMFIKQAIHQFTTWFPNINANQVEQILTNSVLENLRSL
ncbi:MAG: shikimate dehydrogenase [Chlamydiales bacterium]|nr:shikimate dehydrogenase [Chlamydiales bacterium]